MNAIAVQRMVLAWILGPFVLVLGCYLLAGLLGLLVEPTSHSWLASLGLFFVTAGYFGTFAAAHAFALFGLIGLVKLSRTPLPSKPFTLAVCLAGLALGTVLLTRLYLGLY
jgi:hypothetical protein